VRGQFSFHRDGSGDAAALLSMPRTVPRTRPELAARPTWRRLTRALYDGSLAGPGASPREVAALKGATEERGSTADRTAAKRLVAISAMPTPPQCDSRTGTGGQSMTPMSPRPSSSLDVAGDGQHSTLWDDEVGALVRTGHSSAVRETGASAIW